MSQIEQVEFAPTEELRMDGEMVHRGFQDQYKERRGPLLQLMEQLNVIEQLKASNKPLLLTGHRCAVVCSAH